MCGQSKGPEAGKNMAFSKDKSGPGDWSTLSEGESGEEWDWRGGDIVVSPCEKMGFILSAQFTFKKRYSWPLGGKEL